MTDPATPPLAPPAHDAPPLAWALYYLRAGLGVPLPIRSPGEAEAFAAWEIGRWDAENPQATDAERDDHYRRTLARAGKSPMIEWRGGMWVTRPPTEDQVAAWFGGHPERRIFLLCGPGTGLTAIDVDTYKGGEPEPWASLASIVVETPSGGLQAWFAEAEVPTDSERLGPGLDRRGRGGGVAAPSGSATPGRAFVRFKLPLAPFPAEALADARPAGPAPPGLVVPAGPLSTMAQVLRGPCPDGTRTESAKELVGMLCRPRPVPVDAAAEVLALLEQRFADLPPEALSILRAGWADALASPAVRGEPLVVAVVEAWAAMRCTPPWRPSNGSTPGEVASSLWRTASSAEAARLLVPPPPAQPLTPPSTAAPAGQPPDPPSTAAPARQPDDPALRYWAPREGDRYTLARYRERRAQGRISVARLPAWCNRADAPHDLSPWGHGLGRWIDRAIGGLRPGRVSILGARKAKSGKTAFVHQLASGLAMLSAERELAGGDAPLILTAWVTEMDLDDLPERGLARHLGVSQSTFQGDPDPLEADLVDAYLAAEERGEGDLYSRARHRFTRLVEIGELLRGSPPDYPPRKDGPELLASVEALVERAAQQLEQETGRRVWRFVVIDPYQRRAEEGLEATEGETSIGKLIRGLADRPRPHLAPHEGEVTKWIVMMTSDATKASATDEIDPTLPPDIVVTSTLRGSYAVTHHADVTMAIDVESGPADQDERPAKLYVGVTRGAPGSERPLPLRYYRSLGRFVAVDPTPQAQPPAQPPPGSQGPAPDGGVDTGGGAVFINGPCSDNPPAPRKGRGSHLTAEARRRRQQGGT